MIAFVMIGNTDDKLSQAEWALFIRRVQAEISRACQTFGNVQGEWFSPAPSRWQNAAWAIEFDTAGHASPLRQRLKELTPLFGQDSIGWAEAEVEFLSMGAQSPPAMKYAASVRAECIENGEVG